MESRPIFLQGRGRGRGRTGGGSRQSPIYDPTNQGRGRAINISPGNSSASVAVSALDNKFWNKRNNIGSGEVRFSVGESSPNHATTAEERFHDVAASHQEAVHRHLTHAEDEEYNSSSEEDDLDNDSILSSVLKSFKTTGESSTDELGRTHEYLLTSMKSKANICLVCIETIKRNEAMWCCSGCYTMFHIPCIQKWVKEGIYQQTLHSDDDGSAAKTVPWHCPKCRHEYPQSECPTRYYCFCGKEEDPTFDPWIVPHSCGQTCSRWLKPDCGHACLLLCHPGPCPSCPQTVRVPCYCGNSETQTRRCGTKEWSCGKTCGQELSCGHHKCRAKCHPGECPPCPEKSRQACECGSEREVRPCATATWQCTKVCNKTLSCGQHLCEEVCHAGDCGNCPRQGKRTCPCGKTVFDLPCTEDVATCLDTCDKLLQCGTHRCTQRCHMGPCATCRQVTVKACRCGARSKEVPCFKDYTCDVKCPKMKDCRKHPCKRKCCDGDCPPCEQQCNKTLGCRNHKCPSRCHRGPCYPCPLTVTKSCNCGVTTLTVPCGRERHTKPPRCNKPCKVPPDCHHSSRTKHKCHFGRCPPCKQTCNKSMPQCDHPCSQPCHSAVFKKVQKQVQRAGPWEPEPETKMMLVNEPCPPCGVPIPISCLGGHEVVHMACGAARVSSCHRPCGRQVTCTNHNCQRECHKVSGAPDDDTAGQECQQCEEACLVARPDGCSHMCLLPCHPGECPPCKLMIRMRCHCQLIVQHIECYKWTDASDREKQRLKSCPSRCPKILSCGHQCTAICHAGTCPSPDKCTEKVRRKCPCQRRKEEFVCNELQEGYAKVECNEVCHQRKEKVRKEEEEKRFAKEQEEQKKQKKELEDFERHMRPRKRKPRKPRQEETEPSFWERRHKSLIASAVILIIGVVLYYLMYAVE